MVDGPSRNAPFGEVVRQRGRMLFRQPVIGMACGPPVAPSVADDLARDRNIRSKQAASTLK